MGLNMRHSEGITLQGRSTLRAFEAGIIPGLLAQGFLLTEAIEYAVEYGYCRHVNTVNNMVVTLGKQLVGDLLTGDVTTGLTYHAIGTGTTAPALTDTKLTTEVVRKAVTLKTRNGNTITLSTYYTSAQSTYNIQEGGIFGDDASATTDSGTLFSHFLQAYDNSAGEYDLTFEYNVEVK